MPLAMCCLCLEALFEPSFWFAGLVNWSIALLSIGWSTFLLAARVAAEES